MLRIQKNAACDEKHFRGILVIGAKIIPRRIPRFSRREREKLGERGHRGLPASCLTLIRQGQGAFTLL
jgi:hypothetical protein